VKESKESNVESILNNAPSPASFVLPIVLRHDVDDLIE
jgi:hypothetical protein